MDRNNIIGISLIFVILIGWYFWMGKQREQYLKSLPPTPDTLVTSPTIDTFTAPINLNPEDSASRLIAEKQFGDWASSAIGTTQLSTLENEVFKVTFSNQGGRITQVELKNYDKEYMVNKKDRAKTKVLLLEDSKNQYTYQIPGSNSIIQTSDLFFQSQVNDRDITFQALSARGEKITLKYSLGANNYLIKHELRLDGFARAANENILLRWDNYMDKLEINENFEKYYSTMYFKSADEDPDYCSCRANDQKSFENNPLKWVSSSNQFFNTSIIAEQPFKGGELATVMMEATAPDLKQTSARLILNPISQQGGLSVPMTMYVGPNDFNNLRALGVNLEDIIPFGRSLFGTINRWIIRPLFDFLASFIGSKGIVILILTLIVKLLLYPFSYKTLASQAKMSALKPQMAVIREKYKDDQQTQQMETMKLYREFGVNPLGGCLPTLLQMPIWFALYRFFPASIEFRQASFLWAHDLSSFDVFFRLPFELPFGIGSHISLLTLLWTASTLAYTYYNSKMMDMSAVNPAFQWMQYLMPVMFMVYFNSYASGLTLYLLFSNLLNIAQTVGSQKFLFDTDKILLKLEENKKKPKKKGGFQERLEAALKEQQRIQQERQKKK